MPEELTTATAGGEIGTEQQTSTEQVVQGDTGQVGQTTPQGTTQQQQQQQTQQERMFKQSELDQIIKDRIAREQQRFEREMKSHPTLSYLTEKAQRLGLSVEQLIENDRKYEEQEQLNRLIQQNIPPEYAKEMLDNRKFREQYQSEKQAAQQRERQQKMYAEFLEAYPDAKPEEIPPEVWAATKRGEPLLSAYARYENKQLKAEMAKFQQQQQTQQANNKNAASSTGSARSSGQTGTFFTREQVEAMTTAEVAKNLTAIKESRKHWK